MPCRRLVDLVMRPACELQASETFLVHSAARRELFECHLLSWKVAGLVRERHQ